MESGDCEEIDFSSCDLGDYDEICLKRHLMTVVIRGYEIPIWRAIENFLYVVDQDTDEAVPFRLRWGQKLLYLELLKQCLMGKPMRQDVLKSRQIGFSTLIAGIFFVITMFRPNTRACVMADVESHASNIFSIYSNFYWHLDDSLPNAEEIHRWEEENPGRIHPDSLKPELAKTRDGKCMVTKDGHSMLEVIVAGDSAGRSAHYTLVHSSETAFQKDLKKTNRSLLSTLSMKNPMSMAFFETTANGYNAYKDMWDEHTAGRSLFNPLFVAWFQNPDYVYDVPPTGIPKMDSWIYAKWKEHPEVTQEQAMWYWIKYTTDFGGADEDGMKQEYPWDARDAFIASGKSIFDTKKILARKDVALLMNPTVGEFSCRQTYSADGMNIQVSDVVFDEDRSGAWKIYFDPEPKKHYCVICDPTKGMNSDYSAIQVIEQNSARQVATFNAKTDLDEVARQIYCVGKTYNWALVSSENNTGPTILDLLVKMAYPKIYVDQQMVYEDFGESYTKRYGHNTNKGNREAMIANFEMAFRNDPTIINDIETLNQMERFQIVKNRTGQLKAMANGSDAHDDLVMAYVPFWNVRQQQEFDAIDSHTVKRESELIDTQDKMMALLMKRHREEKRRKSVANAIGIKW